MAVTIREVARVAGASTAAASAALNGTRSKSIRVGPDARARIIAAAAQLGYVSNPVARSLATGKSKVLGVLLPYAEAFTDDNPFCAQVTNGILQEVVKHNYNLMLYTGVWSNGDHVEMGIDSRVDGVVLVMPPSNSPVFLKCEARHIPYVSILREPIAGTRTVNSDDFKGGVFATDHLISMGHKRIAHLVGDEEVCTTRPRREGYLHALAEAGIASDKNLMIKGGFNWRQGYEAAKALLDLPSYKRPTAVFAANDLCADGAMRAFREAGVRIPDDMSVVGYDDTWFAAMTQPALTSVRMPIVEMGALAIQLLVNQVERRESVDPHPVLPVSLTVRNSCGGRPAPPDQTFLTHFQHQRGYIQHAT